MGQDKKQRSATITMIGSSSRSKGAWYERQAQSYLEKQGLQLVEANYNIRGGELDLIMRHGEELVFVEVRYRQSKEFGGAAASITASKQAKIRRTTLHYLQSRRLSPDRTFCRFDVIAISGEHPDIELDWIRNAF